MERSKVVIHHRLQHQAVALRDVLEGGGHAVELAESFPDVLQLLRAEDVSVLVCNYHGTQDCIRMMAMVRQRFSDVARLLLVKDPDRDFAQRALDSDLIHHFVCLPVSQESLVDTVDALKDWSGRQNRTSHLWDGDTITTPAPA